MKKEQSMQPGRENEQRGHETRDVHFYSLLSLGAVLAVIVTLCSWLAFGLYQYFQRYPEKVPLPTPLAGSRPIYTGPKLQTQAQHDLKEWRNKENEILSSYGWIDPEKGIVRIPISRAMELIDRKGLPKTVEGPAIQ